MIFEKVLLPMKQSLPNEVGCGPILVVDDHPAVLQSMQMMLRVKGFTTLTAGGGAEAVSLLQQNLGKVGIVITDLMMPGMDGRDTIRALRGLDANLQFIVISGAASPEEVSELYAMGVVEFLAKPFGLTEMIRALEKAISLRRNDAYSAAV
jgi:DNA-binding NtrC family response regulator